MPAKGETRRKSVAKDGASGVRERFIEQMGIIAQGDGVPRIAGRMMGLMIFDGRPYSFSELATELQVSRGSVSTNARILEQMGIIERTAVPGERQDYFQLADSPYEAVLSGALARARKCAPGRREHRRRAAGQGAERTEAAVAGVRGVLCHDHRGAGGRDVRSDDSDRAVSRSAPLRDDGIGCAVTYRPRAERDEEIERHERRLLLRRGAVGKDADRRRPQDGRECSPSTTRAPLLARATSSSCRRRTCRR